jgi:hypothetical protein
MLILLFLVNDGQFRKTEGVGRYLKKNKIKREKWIISHGFVLCLNHFRKFNFIDFKGKHLEK